MELVSYYSGSVRASKITRAPKEQEEPYLFAGCRTLYAHGPWFRKALKRILKSHWSKSMGLIHMIPSEHMLKWFPGLGVWSGKQDLLLCLNQGLLQYIHIPTEISYIPAQFTTALTFNCLTLVSQKNVIFHCFKEEIEPSLMERQEVTPSGALSNASICADSLFI